MSLGLIIFTIGLSAAIISIAGNFIPLRRHKIEHPYFGNLLFFNLGNPEKDYWEGKVKLQRPLEEIEVFMNADKNGPNEKHVKFCQDIEKNIIFTVKEIENSLGTQWANLWNKPFPSDFFSELTCVGVNIPQEGNSNNSWDISFETRDNYNHHFTVYFEGGKPIHVIMNG